VTASHLVSPSDRRYWLNSMGAHRVPSPVDPRVHNEAPANHAAPAPHEHRGCGSQVRRRHCHPGRTSSSVPLVTASAKAARSISASTWNAAWAATAAASGASQARGSGCRLASWARISGQAGSRSARRRSRHHTSRTSPRRHAGRGRRASILPALDVCLTDQSCFPLFPPCERVIRCDRATPPKLIAARSGRLRCGS
jgi:hypothetical protein